MIELILFLVIVVLSCVILITQYTGIKEREKLIKLILAKDLKEVTDNEYTQKLKPPKAQPPPEAVDIAEDETIFDKAIQAQIEYGKRTSGSS